MKRLFYLMAMVFTLSFTSCLSEAQIAYDAEYFDYYNNWTVVYYNQLPYYRFWENYQWVYRPVPRDRIPYIRIRPDYNRGRGFTPQRGFQPRMQGQQGTLRNGFQGGQTQRSQGVQQGTLRSGFQGGMQSHSQNGGGMTRGGMSGGSRSGGSMGGGRR